METLAEKALTMSTAEEVVELVKGSDDIKKT